MNTKRKKKYQTLCISHGAGNFLMPNVLILLNGSVSMEVTPGMSFLSVQQPHTDNASILAMITSALKLYREMQSRQR